MPTYTLLTLPTQNRVYGRAAAELGLAELATVDRLRLGGRLGQPTPLTLGGRLYYRLETDRLDQEALASVASLSTVYAAFELRGEALAPIELPAV
ncbi:MAG TPA: SAM-dependent methyltransferase, partial [Candidatus Dormibacteraeota bacterium]